MSYVRERLRPEWRAGTALSRHWYLLGDIWAYTDSQWDSARLCSFSKISDDHHRGADRPVLNVRHEKREFNPAGQVSWYDWSGIHGYVQNAFAWPDLGIDERDLAVPLESSNFGGMAESLLETIGNSGPAAEAVAALPILGELRETISMIRRPTSFLDEASALLTKKAFRKPPWMSKSEWKRYRKSGLPLGTTLREAGLAAGSDGWLQYNYGWAPFFGDLVKSGKALLNMDTAYREYLRQSGGRDPIRRRTLVRSGDASTQLESNDWTGVKFVGSSSHKARCTFWYRYEPEGQTLSYCDFVRSKFGLTPSSIIPAMWELIPYSFVVDWFIPVGKKLAAATSTPAKFSIVKQQYDYTIETKGQVRVRLPGSGILNPPLLGEGGHLGDFTETVYERHPYPFLDGADPEGTWFTLGRALSAMALISQALRLPIPK